MTKNKSSFHLETALDELNTIVSTMEKGGHSLDDAMSSFEKGVLLSAQCQKALKNAKQRVGILMKKKADNELQSYQSDE